MTVLEYYKKNNFNPVPIKFLSKSSVNSHYIKRINLLENHLNIYLPLLKKKDVLEFGCNGAENACLLAEYGANLYLVEPHKKIHHIIKNNFKRIRKKKSLKLLSNKKLEDFNIKKKFDIIVAEGFLNTLKNRNNYFKRISEYLNPGGLLIINYDDIYGGFFEYLKSYILIKTCFKLKIKPDSKRGYKIAETLFKKQFNNLNKSRNFRSWWKDQLINPYAAKTWSFEDLIKLANSKKLICYSTSPAFNDSSLFNWYKDIAIENLKYNFINGKFFEIWKKNFFNFFVGSKIETKNQINKKLLLNLKKFIQNMNMCLENRNLNNEIKFPKQLNQILKKNGLNDYSDELNKLIKLLNEKKENSKKIIDYYLKTKKISKTWGNLLHYVVFKKKV